MKVQVNIFLWGDHVNKVFDNIVIPLQKKYKLWPVWMGIYIVG